MTDIETRARELLANAMDANFHRPMRSKEIREGWRLEIAEECALAALTEALTRIEELEGKLEIRRANQETPRYVLAAQEPDDVLYPRALEILDGNEFISCSMLQRALQIGYNRACRFIEKMEETGLVSAHEGYGKYRNLASATLTKGIKE